MPHYYGAHDPVGDTAANCYNGHCWCDCWNWATGNTTGMNSVPELTCSEEETGNQWGSVCEGACNNWCLTYDHMHFPWEPPQPRPARPRQPYTPGRRGRRRGASTKSSMRRGYNKGGKVNTSNKSRFAGRSQSNPKGKFKK